MRLMPGILVMCSLFSIVIAIGRWTLDYDENGEWRDPASGDVFDTTARLGYTIGAVVLTLLTVAFIVSAIRSR